MKKLSQKYLPVLLSLLIAGGSLGAMGATAYALDEASSSVIQTDDSANTEATEATSPTEAAAATATKSTATAASKKTSIKTLKLYLKKTVYVYNGKAKKPKVVVKDTSGNTISSKYYTVKYSKGRKNVGTYTVRVTMKGSYKGTKTLKFKIIPKSSKITKKSSTDNSVTVKWSKVKKQVSGYQIQYSTSSKFKKSKTVTVSAKKLTATLSKLSSNTKYYVRVRVYKKSGGKKYCSKWSKKVSVTTQKQAPAKPQTNSSPQQSAPTGTPPTGTPPKGTPPTNSNPPQAINTNS